jgi:hypothetical protein
MRVLFSSKNSQLVHPQFVVLKMSGTTDHYKLARPYCSCNHEMPQNATRWRVSVQPHKPPDISIRHELGGEVTAARYSEDPNARENYFLYKENDFMGPTYFKLISQTKTQSRVLIS